MSDVAARLGAVLSDRYAIEREIGAGGMATVYLAKDLRHHRRVALKVLRPELAAVLGPERFLSEIQTTANLQHPHLLPLFDSGEAEGLLFYVMPYVEGESLRQRLDRERQLPVDEAIRISAAVASALDYAHRHQVVHRDLKPENILLHEGQPLVADFGIALAVSAAGGARVTQTGLSLGTPAYMSPEQATGDRGVDARSDQYALAAVTYEMLVGEPPHTGSTVQALIARLLTERPRSVRISRPSVPEHVDAALQKALEKLPADRFATVGEFADGLTGARPVATGAVLAAALPAPDAAREGTTLGRRVKSMLPWLTAAVAILVAGASLWAGSRSVASPVSRWAVSLPPTDVLSSRSTKGPGPRVALSPDGRTLVYAATRDGIDRLYRRPIDQLEAVAIPGTEGGRAPFFSPDGQWLGFLADLKLKKVALAGGPAVTITEVQSQFMGASWGPDDRIVFGGGFPSLLYLVPAAGGAAQPLTDSLNTDETAQGAPQFLPGGKAILFASVTGGRSRMAALTLDSGERHPLLDGSNPRYTPTGRLLFYRDGSVWAVQFDADRLTVTGEPVPIVEGVSGFADCTGARGVTSLASTGLGVTAEFDVSPSGALVYQPCDRNLGGQLRTLVWVDRQGREEPLAAPPRAYVYPRISPDGTQVALDIRDQEYDIWVWDFARGTLARVTFNPGIDIVPAWTPDGRRIAFMSGANLTATQDLSGSQNLYWRLADGTGVQESLLESTSQPVPTSFYAGGRQVLLRSTTEGFDLLSVLSLDGDRSVTPLVKTRSNNRNGEISPDGRWLAYQSDESGRDEIYVRPLPNVDEGRWQMSTSGGTRPLWARSGRELFFVSPDGRIMVVPIGTGTVLAAGTPEALPIKGSYFGLPTGLQMRSYDISPDGRRFLLLKQSGVRDDARANSELVVLLNWVGALEQQPTAGGAGR